MKYHSGILLSPSPLRVLSTSELNGRKEKDRKNNKLGN
jgi:hypothetical protein